MKVVLTFDIEPDLPNVLNTYSGIKIGLLKILRLLKYYDLKATFFCTGTIAQDFPSYLKLIESNGHEIACHGWNHERLSQMNFEKCRELIFKSKKILEKTCPNSKIIGFRAPYLSPPTFLFEILYDLGFIYDSSITSHNKQKTSHKNFYKVTEFSPCKLSGYFRFPLTYNRIKKATLKTDLIIFYFHSWEFLNMKRLILKKSNINIALKNILFRPDRWWNTGISFTNKLSLFINDFISNQIEFITLKKLCYN
jgi:peptidoglycan/xylan/chitin deacetylase (PgdA/CDA1 family)